MSLSLDNYISSEIGFQNSLCDNGEFHLGLMLVQSNVLLAVPLHGGMIYLSTHAPNLRNWVQERHVACSHLEIKPYILI